jgi:hypothetical protein
MWASSQEARNGQQSGKSHLLAMRKTVPSLYCSFYRPFNYRIFAHGIPKFTATSRRVRTVCVNPNGKRKAHRRELSLHQFTREHGLKIRVMLWIGQIVCSFCFFSAQRSEQETNRFAVNLHRSSAANRSRSSFSRGCMVDSYVWRQNPLFRAKKRRTFAPFTTWLVKPFRSN